LTTPSAALYLAPRQRHRGSPAPDLPPHPCSARAAAQPGNVPAL